MKQLLRNIILFGALCLSFLLAKADIGETFALKQERTRLLTEIRTLKSDSTASRTEISNLQLRVISLDQKIFGSYEETINRVASQRISQNSNDKSAIYLALAMSVIAVFFAAMLMMARSRIITGGNAGLRDTYRQLTVDFMRKVSANKTASPRMLKVNVVVVLGLIMMSVSVVAFLIRSL